MLKKISYFFVIYFSIISCSAQKKNLKIETHSVKSGEIVYKGKVGIPLYDTGSIKIGDSFEGFAKTLGIQLDERVMLVSIVPSLDTLVCEEQTHFLSEDESIPQKIRRITISRDTPMAQSRFKTESSLNNIEFFSDFKFGEFGKLSGLLIDSLRNLIQPKSLELSAIQILF